MNKETVRWDQGLPQLDSVPLSAPRSVEDHWPVCDSEPLPLIKPGDYEAFCTGARCYQHPRYKRDVIAIRFKIVTDNGKVELCRFYNGKNANRPASDYYREWTVANCGMTPRRRDRMTGTRFVGKLFRVKVETVEQSYRQQKLGTGQRYSKVSAVLELLASNEAI